jgi:hypothetical protein
VHAAFICAQQARDTVSLPSAKVYVPRLLLATLIILTSATSFADDSECKTAFGKTACGFHCTAGFGDVQCSETDAGACIAAFGRVLCWDAPHRYRRLAREMDPVQCVAAYGDLACGYGCTSGFGEVKCSPRPGGSCMAADGHVTCAR